ncbi:RING-H2 finger protein ATL67 [Syzygium oleosum]|uniref:RING-H2 finger protein ATL67 n=1 Tax=Syzygium oleosum TaxID=219896 RepID=UPI0024BB2415|nr:RING-H2 finger protein ATL67 [Syzygium oleosum]
MSSAAAAAAPPPPPPPPPPPLPPPSSASYLTNLGLGYAIAVALGFLVLLSSVLLASYICCRSSRRRRLLRRQQHQQQHHHAAGAPASAHRAGDPGSDGIILPRIIFVAEDDNEGSDADQGAAVGLDPSVINSYPKFAFSREGVGVGVGSSTTCSICLCEYKDSEMLRMMPECRHFFHLLCLDAWLKLNGSCPVCRNSPLPTPLSTPLSEVVPLSQYGEDRRRRR